MMIIWILCLLVLAIPLVLLAGNRPGIMRSVLVPLPALLAFLLLAFAAAPQVISGSVMAATIRLS